MIRLFRRRAAPPDPATVIGHVRIDRRTKHLVRRLHPGEIAVIDHEDLDTMAAEGLISAKPGAVLNADRSATGRYPNRGPSLLLDAGILLVDGLGPAIMSLRDGQRIRVHDGEVHRDGHLVATGTVQTAQTVRASLDAAQRGLAEQIEAFAANTMEFVQKEQELLFEDIHVPELATRIDGRQVLIVVRGEHYREDLAALKPYISEYRPVLIGVDGGADALLDAGLKPQLIVGDMDSVSDGALRKARELVIHAYRDGAAPGLDRVRELGLDYHVMPAAGTSEDVAMLLADALGASLIVAVGSHQTLVEFLDKGRAGMASTFLTRLRIGGKLVDAKGVSRLYRQRISWVPIVLLGLAGLAALTSALAATSAGQAVFPLIGARLDEVTAWFNSWLPW